MMADCESTSPAVEGTKAVIDDIIDGATAAVEDIVDTIRNSAVLAPPGLIWLSDTSRSDIGYYGYVHVVADKLYPC